MKRLIVFAVMPFVVACSVAYQFKHVQIDPKTQSDAMQSGTLAGSVAYTTSGLSLAPYWKETEVRMDLKVINPCRRTI